MSTPDTMVGGTPSNPFGDAAAATRAMIDAANAEPTVAPNTAPAEAAPPVDTTQTEGTPPPAQDTGTPMSWDTVDLSALDSDTAKFVQEHGLRHSDYTRKTQELAEQRKQIEQFGDVETVQQAMEFVQNLQDPDFLRQLNADITAHLEGGQPAAHAESAPLTDPTTSTGLDPATQSAINELKAWKAEQEHARQEADLVEQMQNTLQTAENAIRQDYPTYTQKDIDNIYGLLGNPDVGYDLFKAQERFENMRQYFTESLIGNKGNFPDAANNVRSDTLVHQPSDMTSMSDAKKATAELFARG